MSSKNTRGSLRSASLHKQRLWLDTRTLHEMIRESLLYTRTNSQRVDPGWRSRTHWSLGTRHVRRGCCKPSFSKQGMPKAAAKDKQCTFKTYRRVYRSIFETDMINTMTYKLRSSVSAVIQVFQTRKPQRKIPDRCRQCKHEKYIIQ